jgi:DNA-binding response OmpR family regulator
MDSPLNIVVVEDHDGLRDMTVQALKELDCLAVGVSCAEEVDESSYPVVDIYIIDLNLPGEDGISLSNRIRASSPKAGIIIISARKLIHQKLEGYESGADFYLTKPTSIEELSAVIKAFKRRFRGVMQSRDKTFKLNVVEMNLYSAYSLDDKVGLAHHEVTLLAALARAPNNRLENWQLIQLSGKNGVKVSKGTLEVQILRLRKKLLQVGASETAIKGIRGLGYQLCISLVLV